MFAVPGWNLAKKVPVAGTEKDIPDAPQSRQPASSTPSSSGKKRKRSPEQIASVSPESLDRLWDMHFGDSIDGKGHIKAKQKKQKKDATRRSGQKVAAVARSGPGPMDISVQEGHLVHGDRVITNSPNQSRSGIHSKPRKGKPNRADNHRRLSDAGAERRKEKPVARDIDSKVPAPPPPPSPQSSLTPLQQSMRAKLVSARFRHLNETLYTADSSKALSMFSESPELFSEYHAGFSQQVKDSWPENPVDLYIKIAKSRGKIPFKLGKEGKPLILNTSNLPLPRRPHGICTIADLGCGDAPLARGLQSSSKHLKLKLFNFDLHPANDLITKADISNLPLQDGEVDVAVFCLSLMGTNWISFVEEAWRILRGDGRGEVWVAEVKSRFGRIPAKQKDQGDKSSKAKKKKQRKLRRPDNDGSDSAGEEVLAELESPYSNGPKSQNETDVTGFVEVFQRRGFALRQGSVNKSNKMFVSMVFTKSGVPLAGKWKGMKWVGTRYDRVDMGTGKMRFLESARDAFPSAEEERQVLKPCVYKTR